MTIKKAAVIGAGIMGSGIAAQIANAGVPVVLLDIVPKGATNRNAIAEGAVAKLLKSDPAAFMHPKNARLVTTGNLEDDIALLKDCDWIVEAVLEDPGIKRALYQKLEAVRKPGSIVSSNTSTIPLALLVKDMPASFQGDFLITHFFNPPRYMRLLELVAGPATRQDAASEIADFCDVVLGKGVVRCKDRPGFIANRIGGLWIQAAINAALDLGLTVEEADAVPHVAASMKQTLPADDPYIRMLRFPPLFQTMIDTGYTGRKGKGGFYRLNREGGGRVKESIDLKTGTYRPSAEPRLDSLAAAARDPGALLHHPDRGGEFARRVLLQTLAYAAMLVPEIADDIVAVDEAMRLGYAWKLGPFELIDQIGVDTLIAGLKQAKMPVPKLLEIAAGKSFYRTQDGRHEHLTVAGDYAAVERAPGVLLLADIKRRSKPLAKNAAASVWDIGDGVLCLEFHSKMNALDGDSVAMIGQALALTGAKHKALVIYNEGSNFSVGANIGLALYVANVAAWPLLEETIAGGQKTYKAVKYAPFPVVAAPSGMALGGGCEILLHCAAVQAHAETYMGLVETGVGLVPGWGGCKETITRHMLNDKRPGGPMPPLSQAFEQIAMAKVSKSAEEARDLLYLRPSDGVTMNRDRLLADAKAKALSLAKDYRPPVPQALRLPGPTGRAALDLAVGELQRQGKAAPHDGVVVDKLAEVLSGGATDLLDEVGEDQLYALERAAFLALLREPATLARMEHMLETGKPLRN